MKTIINLIKNLRRYMPIHLSDSYLKIIFIYVGAGDSIYIEHKVDSKKTFRFLIDSNDSTNLPSSKLFLKRYFETNNVEIGKGYIFDSIYMTHDHADHGQGLKDIMRTFGTNSFYLTGTNTPINSINLIKYCNRVKIPVRKINNSLASKKYGNLEMQFLWPSSIVERNENNNSLVLLLRYGDKSILLTGDIEADVMNNYSNNMSFTNINEVTLIKIPHHGASNSLFYGSSSSSWIDDTSKSALKIISCHIKPYGHPDCNVVSYLSKNNHKILRTDKHYSVIFETDGKRQRFSYTH